MTPGIEPNPNPEHDPIRLIDTERLIQELVRRAVVHVIAMVEEVEDLPGLRQRVPRITWGSKSGQAHEALGLAHQVTDLVMLEARYQIRLGGSLPEDFFRNREQKRSQQIAPLTYQYIPPGSKPAPGANP